MADDDYGFGLDSFLDPLKKLTAGIMPQPESGANWTPDKLNTDEYRNIIRKQYPPGPDGQPSPQEALLDATTGYAKRTPMLDKPPEKWPALIFGPMAAVGDAMAQKGPGGATTGANMLSYIDNRRDAYTNQAAGIHSGLGNTAFGLTGKAIDQAEALKLAQAAADRNANAVGLGGASAAGPIYGSGKKEKAAASTPTIPVPNSLEHATPQRGAEELPGGLRMIEKTPGAPPLIENGKSWEPPAATPEAPAAPAAPEPNAPQQLASGVTYYPGGYGTEGQKFVVGSGPNALAFHNHEVAQRFLAEFKMVNANLAAQGGGGLTQTTDPKTGAVTTKAAQDINSLIQKYWDMDQNAWKGSVGYKLNEQGQTKEQDQVIGANTEMLKGYRSSASAAMNNSNVIGIMTDVAKEAQQPGSNQLGLGKGNSFLSAFNGYVERFGPEGAAYKQGAVSLIKELQNRAGVEAAQEEANGTGRGAGQRVMMQFLAAVPNADMPNSGFFPAAAAIQAINTYHIKAGQIAEQLMAQPGAIYTERQLQQKVAAAAQPYFEEAVKKAHEALGNMREKPGEGGMGPGKPMAVSYEEFSRRTDELIAKGMPPQQAMEQARMSAGSSAPAPTAGATAPAPTAGAPAAPAEEGWLTKRFSEHEKEGEAKQNATAQQIRKARDSFYRMFMGKGVRREDYGAFGPGAP